MMKLKISEHAKHDRQERFIAIATTCGFGEVVLKVKQPQNNNYACLTSTGIILIMAEDDTLVTLFPANIDKALAMYHSVEQKMPTAIRKVIEKNAKRFRHLMK